MEQAFCRMYYKLKHHGDPIFSQMLSNLQKIRYSRMLWSEDVISLNKKISDILSQVQFLTQLQQAGGVDPDTFISSNNKLSEQLRIKAIEEVRPVLQRVHEIAGAIRQIVDSNERLRFRLKNGLELLEQIERTRR